MLSESHHESLPDGVRLVPLTANEDERGRLTEVFREEWQVGMRPVQWNAVHTKANTLRGIHVHLRHSDYLVVPIGTLFLGIKDLRKRSKTYMHSALITLDGPTMSACVIPPGVAHGFYAPGDTLFLYSVSDYWSPADELGCRWNDPEVGIAWPAANPLLSERDRHAPSFGKLMEQLKYVDFPSCL